MTIQVVVEGDTDVPIAEKLVQAAGLEVSGVLDMAGKPNLDAKLDGFNQAARGSPWFVLRDLDADAGCAPEFLSDLGFRPAKWMAYRIAVRELESWLLADKSAIASFLHVREAWLPGEPDGEVDPTRTLVNLARRSSRRHVRDAFVPHQGAATPVGPLYEAEIIRFGRDFWDLSRAVQNSPSLASAAAALKAIGRQWQSFVKGR